MDPCGPMGPMGPPWVPWVPTLGSQGQRDPQVAHKRTDIFTKCFVYFFGGARFLESRPLGSPIRQLPGSLGGLNPTFVQQRLPPELPRASGAPQGAHKRTDIFTKLLCIFWGAARFEKSDLLGSCLVDCLACWEVCGQFSSNKDCRQSSQGPI